MEWERKERTYRSIPFLVIIKLLRSFRGLNFVGIDSHVLRPIITAFWVFCGLVVVTLLSVSTTLEVALFIPIQTASASLPVAVARMYGLAACSLWPDDLPLAKYFISPGRRHGNPPFNPIPLDLVAATIAVRFGVDILTLNIYLTRKKLIHLQTRYEIKRGEHLDNLHVP